MKIAANQIAAFDGMAKFIPDLVLLTRFLPGHKLIDLVAYIRSIRRDTKILLLTSTSRGRETAELLGIQFSTKPVVPSEFLKFIECLLVE